MTFVVPFDGSELAEAALVRAAEFGTVLDERVLAFTVVPLGNAEYARERGWLEPDEGFDTERIVSRLHERVTELYPAADFRHETVDRYAPPGTIARRVRTVAREAEASMVFIGSENAGRLVTSVSSVGGSVATSGTYDVVIVRHRSPTTIAKLDEVGVPEGASDFYGE